MVVGEPHVYPSNVIRRTVDLEPNETGEHNSVQNVVIISVDLDCRGIWLSAMLLVVIVEVGFAKPATVHHHFVPSVDLQTKLCEVQEVPTTVDKRM